VPIVIDTNILPRNGDLNSLEIQVLCALSREVSQPLMLPSLVLEEAVSSRRREIEDAFDKLLSAHKAAHRFAAIPPLAELPIPGELAREYGEELGRLFAVADLPDRAADEALRREAHRERPARSGAGARDVAIWLTAKSIHATTHGPTFFLSDNVQDFGGDGGALHPDLEREMEALGGDFKYCRSIGDLLAELATHDEPFVDAAFLAAHEETVAAARLGILDPEVLATLSIPENPEARRRSGLYAAGPISATPTDVSGTTGFTIEGRRITVAWTRWQFVIPGGILLGHGGRAQFTSEVGCTAVLQMIVRVAEDGITVDAETLAVRALKQL